jgi:hypothetical protein
MFPTIVWLLRKWTIRYGGVVPCSSLICHMFITAGWRLIGPRTARGVDREKEGGPTSRMHGGSGIKPYVTNDRVPRKR